MFHRSTSCIFFKNGDNGDYSFDISRRHNWFYREMTSEERAEKFLTDDVKLPGSG